MRRKTAPRLTAGGRVVIGCEVPPALRDVIDAEAARRVLKRSDIIREVLLERFRDRLHTLGQQAAGPEGIVSQLT